MVVIKVLGNDLVVFNQPFWSKKRGMGLKTYRFTESKAQAEQRLKLGEQAHALKGTVHGFKVYRGRLMPVVPASIASKITGNTSGFSTRHDWYVAHQPSNEAVEASLNHLRKIAGKPTVGSAGSA